MESIDDGASVKQAVPLNNSPYYSAKDSKSLRSETMKMSSVKDDPDVIYILSLITSCDVNGCSKHFEKIPCHRHKGKINFLNTAIKTRDPKIIDYIFNKVNEVYNSNNYINIDMAFMAEHKMYREFHKLTLFMVIMKPYYNNDFTMILNKAKSQITDEIILGMIESTIEFFKGNK